LHADLILPCLHIPELLKSFDFCLLTLAEVAAALSAVELVVILPEFSLFDLDFGFEGTARELALSGSALVRFNFSFERVVSEARHSLHRDFFFP
jgi:hypothetical protein